eukprot:844924-Prorocentrum_minimum.AAC.6
MLKRTSYTWRAPRTGNRATCDARARSRRNAEKRKSITNAERRPVAERVSQLDPNNRAGELAFPRAVPLGSAPPGPSLLSLFALPRLCSHNMTCAIGRVRHLDGTGVAVDGKGVAVDGKGVAVDGKGVDVDGHCRLLHELKCFDGQKKSCRKMLLRHNLRRNNCQPTTKARRSPTSPIAQAGAHPSNSLVYECVMMLASAAMLSQEQPAHAAEPITADS